MNSNENTNFVHHFEFPNDASLPSHWKWIIVSCSPWMATITVLPIHHCDWTWMWFCVNFSRTSCSITYFFMKLNFDMCSKFPFSSFCLNIGFLCASSSAKIFLILTTNENIAFETRVKFLSKAQLELCKTFRNQEPKKQSFCLFVHNINFGSFENISKNVFLLKIEAKVFIFICSFPSYENTHVAEKEKIFIV